MTKRIEVSISWFRAIVAFQTALGGVLLGWLMLRWPVAAGVVLALAVCVVMWLAIYRLVTSGHQVKPQKPIGQSIAATVDGRAVEVVEVMQP